jgi:hypothetical protein
MTRHAHLAASLTLVVLTGCTAIQRLIKTGEPKTYATARALVKENKFNEAADELRRLQVELQPAVYSSKGTTIYGDVLQDVVRELVEKPLDEARELVKRPERRLDASRVIASLGPAFQSIEGLPVAQFKGDRFALASLQKKRAEVEAAGSALAQGAETQLALLREDEQAGRIGLALYGWSRFVPASPAQEQERAEKLLAFSKQLFAAAGGRFALETAKGAAKNLAPGLADGQARAQNRLATVSFTRPDLADVVATVNAPEPTVKRTSGETRLEWKYPTGKREVANPDYAKLQEKIARLDKEAKWQKDKYDNINCGRGGSVRGRTKAPNGDCAKTYYHSWKKYSKDGDTARKSLSRTKPRKMETVYSVYAYTAKEDVLVVEQPLTTVLRYKDGRPAEKLSHVATLTLKAYTHPAHPPVKLRARNEKLAPDDVAIGLLRGEIAGKVFGIVETAQKGLLAKLEKERSKSQDERVIGEFLIRSGAQSMFKDWNRDYLDRTTKERFGTPLAEAPRMDELFATGVKATHWERITAVAASEEGANRWGSTFAAWLFTPTYDDATKEKRTAKLAETKARLATDQLAPRTVTGGPLAERLATLLGAEPGFPKAEAAPRLAVEITSAAPRIERSSAEVELEQEYVVGEETVENPAYVEREAKRAACLESGEGLCAMMFELNGSGPPETIVQKITEAKAYKAKRDTADLSGEFAVKFTFDGRESTFKLPVDHTLEAFTHAARAETKLAARAEKLPSDAELVARWNDVAAKAAFDALIERLHTPAAEDGPAAKANALLMKSLRLQKVDGRPVWEDAAEEAFGVRYPGSVTRELP